MMLALKMGRTLEELGRTMSSQEFALWLELYEEDLWGEMADYHRAGIVAATVANYAGMMRDKGTGPASPQDFMPYKPKGSDEPETEPDPIEYVMSIVGGKR